MRRFGELSPAERRVIELEENLHRKDLTAFERSKATVQTVEAAKVVAKEEAKAKPEVSGDVRRKPGRPREPDSTTAAAERTGLKRETVRDAEAHVTIAERYPLLQAPDWTQRAAVKVGKLLDAMPAKRAAGGFVPTWGETRRSSPGFGNCPQKGRPPDQGAARSFAGLRQNSRRSPGQEGRFPHGGGNLERPYATPSRSAGSTPRPAASSSSTDALGSVVLFS